MYTRQYSHEKTPFDSDTPSQTGLFRQRPFNVPEAENDEVSPDKQKLPDIQTQLDRSAHFRQSLSRMKVHGNRPVVQPKIAIGAPGDRYEQEADRVAEQVMNANPQPVQREAMPEAEKEKLQMKSLANAMIQREAMPEEEEKVQTKPLLQRASAGNSQDASSNLESQLNSSKGRGSPLSDEVRSFMEPRFGADFSQVRVHTGSEAVQMNQALGAQAFTHKSDVYFGAGKAPGKDALTAHELTHVVQQSGVGQAKSNKSQIGSDYLQRGGLTSENNSSTSTAAKSLGIAGGENQTPSDQTNLAKGYTKRDDNKYNTPYGRVVNYEQALAESQVINSAGIFMIAYLGRYNALQKFSLSQDEIDKLSKDAGFMKQFKTGDVVLRLMQADDSAGIAKLTNSNYSHSGIIQVKDGRVWILDSYPGRGDDSTQLIRFEEFFGDQHGEKIIQGIVLTIEGLSNEIRTQINALIDKYAVEKTSFDREFKIDDKQYVLYCSELVWRILKEAGSTAIPPNEYQMTIDRANNLVEHLQALIKFQKSQNIDTKASESQLNTLRFYLQSFKSSNPELYSPGSLERTEGLKTVTGFTADGKVQGKFELMVVSATISNSDKHWYDTPDPYIKYSGGGLLGGTSQTSAKSDTMSPVWNEVVAELDYESLRSVELHLYDEDSISDDLLATFNADLRAVKPEGQTFELNSSGSNLKVMVKGKDLPSQAPRQTKDN